MNLLFSLLPYLFRLTLAFQSQEVGTWGINIPEQSTFSQESNQNAYQLNLYSDETKLPPLARKLESEEKEVESFDLFVESGFNSTSFYFVSDTSLYFFDYRNTRNKLHLYDLFHSWKTHLS